MTVTRKLISAALLAGCAVSPDATPGDTTDLLPDGTRGVDHVVVRGRQADWPWIVKDGMKFVEDDFAIGPARADVFELASTLTVGKWANNHVPYCILEASHHTWGLTASEQTYLDDALHELEKLTPLHFDRFDCDTASPPASYVDYRHWATTSYNETIGGINHDGWTIQLTPSLDNPSIWHETGHALGYMHEQRRSDRAQFVNFYKSCLSDPTESSQYDVTPTTLELTPYDIDSIAAFSHGLPMPACP